MLMDNLESKMKGNPEIEKVIADLFRGAYTLLRMLLMHLHTHTAGEMKSFVKCTNVEYESVQNESFYDIQLRVRNMSNRAFPLLF